MRGLMAFVLGMVAVALVGASPADAQEYPSLDDRIVDLAGVLSAGERSDALEAFDSLEDDANVQLFALFVDSTGTLAAPEYAEQVAATNGLGGNDALLVVAMDDRRDAIWVGPLLGEVSDEELDRLLAERFEPHLAAGRYGEALVQAARGLAEAQGGSLAQAGDDDGGGSTAGNAVVLVLVVLVVLGGGFLVWRALPGRQPAGPPAEPVLDLDELSRRANALLLETDEDVRQNEQELAFAEAQFGEAEVRPFREALADARESLRAAFTLRQQLDDAEPEPEAEQRRMLDEIVQRCEQAQAVMEAQREHFQALRNLERDAPRLLEQLPAEVEGVERRLPEAEAQVRRIQAEAVASARSVAGNVAEAGKRLAAAREIVAAGREELAQDRRPGAARSVRAAQELVAEAAGLLDEVQQVHAQLDEAREQSVALRAEVASDLAAARSLLEQRPDAGLQARVAAIEGMLTPRQVNGSNVLVEYQQLQEADAAANELLAAATEGVERQRREEAALRHALRNAELELDRAEAYISGRRHGVGRVPRTRLTEARRALERAQALERDQPAEALASAQRAHQLAIKAYESAVAEFDDYDERHGGGFPGTGTGRGRWGADAGSILIGGVIGSILSGGGGGGGGGRRGGGFGGFGRSAGGGFGRGGGGRSRGGAW